MPVWSDLLARPETGVLLAGTPSIAVCSVRALLAKHAEWRATLPLALKPKGSVAVGTSPDQRWCPLCVSRNAEAPATLQVRRCLTRLSGSRSARWMETQGPQSRPVRLGR